MDDYSMKFWLKEHYTTTIVKDRYTGVYSGGLWTCWPMDYRELPHEIEGGDVECSNFWDRQDRSVVGFGSTPDEAMKDLELKFYKAIFKPEQA